MTSKKTSGKKQDFVAYIEEQMASFGSVESKAMFGGFGIYKDALMFALIADGQLYLKADEASVDEFLAKDLRPFTYEAKGKVSSLKYYEAPPEAFEDPEIMALWAQKAYDCALRKRSAPKKSSAKKAPTS